MRRRLLPLAAALVVLALVVAGIVWSRSNPSGPGGRITNQTGVPPTPTPTSVGLGPLTPESARATSLLERAWAGGIALDPIAGSWCTC